MSNFGWFPLSIMAGVLMGFGMIVARTATTGMPSYIFVGILGLVWLLSSGGFMAIRQESPGFGWAVLVLALFAGIFFWSENLLRFHALPKTPLSAYVLLTIEIVGVSMTLVYDLVKLYRSGKLAAVNGYEVGGLILASAAIALFAMAPRRSL
jgi:hypothetical protein